MPMTDEYIFAIISLSFLLLFVGRFVYYRFWIKTVIKRIFSKNWCPEDQKYDRKELANTVIDITNNTKLALSIIEHTTIKINSNLIPVIYGDINFPTIYGKPGNRNVTKGFFTFSDPKTMNNLSSAYPNIFEFAYEFGKIQIFFINRVRNLEKLLLTKNEI
ncbi:MAG: hypothetical protein GY870_04000 [archaeon]|nr:hypothetical protein [archaeon]